MAKRAFQHASRNRLLLTLAERLLAVPVPGVPSQDIQILVGKLPADLPVQIPFPDKYKVIGCVIRSDRSLQIVLDAEHSAEEIIALYRARLTTLGWQELGWPMSRGGFGFGPGSDAFTFCKSARGPSLTFSATPLSGGLSDVRLFLQTDPRQSPCAMSAQSMRPQMPSIPSLRAPAGAKMHGGGGFGGGGNNWYATISLETALDAAALVAHYDRQLETAGWKMVDQAQTQSIASSTWRFSDNAGSAWAGVLVILNNVGPGQERFAYLHVNLAA